MVSHLLTTLEKGLQVMRLNSRLFMVGILIFVFPILFVWITQNFFTTAYTNIDSAQKQRVSILHDSIKVLIEESEDFNEVLPVLLTQYATENADITKVRVVQSVSEGTQIIFSNNQSELSTLISNDALFQNLPLSSNAGAFIFPTTVNGVRTWQVFSVADTSEASYIIFSEHTFQLIDSVMLARQQQSYFGLTAIFLFLIGLAYWLNKQSQWEKHHHKLQRQLEERDLFSNMIAHEFRTPLTAIKGYASFLQESESLDAENKRFANNIRISAERLVLLVNDFLEVARLQSGKMEIHKTEVDISQLLTKVTGELTVTAQEKDLRLIYESPVHPIISSTDPDRLTQVLINVISNSIKYTPAGAIEIECQKEAKHLVILIKDTGTGISAEDQKKLFAPFVRVGGVDSGATTGTGLGMWITKQLVTLLNGDIGVESIKGVGTHIVITLRE
jgi:signal transduction histidine kinase